MKVMTLYALPDLVLIVARWKDKNTVGAFPIGDQFAFLHTITHTSPNRRSSQREGSETLTALVACSGGMKNEGWSVEHHQNHIHLQRS